MGTCQMCTSFPSNMARKTGEFFAFLRRFFFECPRLNAAVPAFERNACLLVTTNRPFSDHLPVPRSLEITEPNQRLSFPRNLV